MDAMRIRMFCVTEVPHLTTGVVLKISPVQVACSAVVVGVN